MPSAVDKPATQARLRKLAARPEPPSSLLPRFGLVVPPSPYVVPTGWEFVHTAPFEGPSVIAGLAKSLGMPFEMLDQREAPDPSTLARGPLSKIDILGVATYADSFPYQDRVTRLAKAERPDRPVVLGGPLVSSAPEVVLGNTAADFAVLGEGELTILELLDHLAGRPGALSPAAIEGLAWKNDEGRVVVNARRPQMSDLDAVPFMDLDAWPSVRESGRSTEIYFQASRGCPNACSFCFRAMPELTHKSPERIRAELLHLKRWSFEFAWWNDLTFVTSQKRTHEVLDAMEGIDFRWSCFTRVVGVNSELFERMRKLGCDIVMYGFESITQTILDLYGKRATPGNILHAIEVARQAGIKVGGLFIIGAPGETEESLENLVDFCDRFQEVTRVKYLSLLPGTPLYLDAKRRGIIADELEHMHFMARERSVEEDEFINVCGLPEPLLRRTYRAVNHRIQVRPYDWRDPANRYLDEPTAFAGRPLSPTGR
jgi:anaerobic magnesium-protoporphyrin IX monomethyl ester cyclase